MQLNLNIEKNSSYIVTSSRRNLRAVQDTWEPCPSRSTSIRASAIEALPQVLICVSITFLTNSTVIITTNEPIPGCSLRNIVSLLLPGAPGKYLHEPIEPIDLVLDQCLRLYLERNGDVVELQVSPANATILATFDRRYRVKTAWTDAHVVESEAFRTCTMGLSCSIVERT